MRVLPVILGWVLTLSASGQRTPAEAASFQAEFTQAYRAYQAGRLAEAATQLETLARRQPASFDVHELLGLTYAAEDHHAQAVEELQAAARLAPRDLSAVNNLATSLVRAGQPAEAEREWRAALAVDPSDYSANRNLARLYLRNNQLSQALPLLETAHRAQPAAADNSYDLALAYEQTGHPEQARQIAESLPARDTSGEVHALLGQIDESQARYVEAAGEFSTAAHLDPSEDNLFIWAGELMEHRAYEAAIKVFEEGTRRYPESPRLWVGQGMALYARGEYEPSIQALLKATDLNAEDARAYLFLSKAYLSSPSQAEAVIDRFRRYAALKPNDALAQYDYAISLWKGRRVNSPEVDYPAVQALLLRSIALDGTDAEVHLQLGILYNDQHRYDLAQAEFERAVALEPGLADAHFRLGRAYLRAGLKEKAQAELSQFQTLQAQHQAALDKERAEVQQFVMATQSAANAGAAGHATP